MRGKAFWSRVQAELHSKPDVPLDFIFYEEMREKLWQAGAASDQRQPHVPREVLPRESYAETFRRDMTDNRRAGYPGGDADHSNEPLPVL